jgi:hypothetical protein
MDICNSTKHLDNEAFDKIKDVNDINNFYCI